MHMVAHQRPGVNRAFGFERALAKRLEIREAVGVHGLLAPAGTPRRIIDRLNAECVAILRSPEVRAQLASEGAEPIGNTPDQYAAYIAAEILKWGKLIKERGIRAE